MKIALTIELEVPDSWQDWTEAELRQNVFDGYVNYATTAHLSDAIRWAVKEDGKRLQDHHTEWGRIARSAVWTLTRK